MVLIGFINSLLKQFPLHLRCVTNGNKHMYKYTRKYTMLVGNLSPIHLLSLTENPNLASNQRCLPHLPHLPCLYLTLHT